MKSNYFSSFLYNPFSKVDLNNVNSPSNMLTYCGMYVPLSKNKKQQGTWIQHVSHHQPIVISLMLLFIYLHLTILKSESWYDSYLKQSPPCLFLYSLSLVLRYVCTFIKKQKTTRYSLNTLDTTWVTPSANIYIFNAFIYHEQLRIFKG